MICGIGAVTAYGWGRDQLWDGLASGESAVVRSTGWEATLGHDVAYMGKVPEIPHTDPRSRFARAMESAMDEAIDDARVRGWKPGRTVGLIHAHRARRGRRVARVLHGTRPSADQARIPATDAVDDRSRTQMQRHGFHGPAMSVTAMCASGNAAMLTAKMWLDAGCGRRRRRRRHRHLGHDRQHPPLRRSRRALRRPAAVRGVPAVPDRQPRLPARRGVGRLRRLPPARARLREGARRRDDPRRLPRGVDRSRSTRRSGAASSSRSSTPESTGARSST